MEVRGDGQSQHVRSRSGRVWFSLLCAIPRGCESASQVFGRGEYPKGKPGWIPVPTGMTDKMKLCSLVSSGQALFE